MSYSVAPLERFRVLAAMMALAALILTGRLWQLQLLNWSMYAKLAAGNRIETVWEPAPRGTILDRNGVVLADNRPVWNVSIRPASFPRQELPAEKVIQRLASMLGQPAPAVREAVRVVRSARANVESAPLPKIGEDVPFEVVAQIEEHSYELPGVEIEETTRRFYPRGNLACHVLGYARSIDAAEYELVKDIRTPPSLAWSGVPELDLLPEYVYTPQSVFGKSGVEKVCEADRTAIPPVPILQGIRGRTRYEVTAAGAPVGGPLDTRRPAPGADVVLTLDARLQAVAQKALSAAISGGPRCVGAAVLLDAWTGEVLVLASVPGYDLNKWVSGWKADELNALMQSPRKPLNDYAIAGLFPPGSVYKLISSAAALDGVALDPAASYECTGRIHAGRDRQPFRCWKRTGHGWLGFYEGFAQSCDVYYYNLVMYRGVTPELLADYSTRFGLGRPTGIELPGEASGLVPSVEWKRRVRRENWTIGNTLHMVIGQGDLQVTPLQMAVVTAAVANGGKLVQPHLIRAIRWPAHTGRGEQAPALPEPVPLDVKPAALEKVRQGMRMACSSRHGTAAWVFRDFGVSVAGKTGSAEHRPGLKPHAWFVAFAPYEAPRYACAVLVSEGGHGGDIAAPVARRILAAAFGLSEEASPTAPPTLAD